MKKQCPRCGKMTAEVCLYSNYLVCYNGPCYEEGYSVPMNCHNCKSWYPDVGNLEGHCILSTKKTASSSSCEKWKFFDDNTSQETEMSEKESEIPEMMTTPEAAKALHRSAQTLRIWACKGGPIKPVRLNGSGGPLLWRKSDVLTLLNGLIVVKKWDMK